MAIGGRKRSMVAADCIGRELFQVRGRRSKPQAAATVNLSGEISREEQGAAVSKAPFV